MKDSLHDIRPLLTPSPSPNIPDEARLNSCPSTDQNYTPSISIVPSSCSTRETSEPFANTADACAQAYLHEDLLTAHRPQYGSGLTSSVPAPVLSDERLSSGSSPRPIVASVSSIGDNIHQGAETSSNHTCPSNQSQITMSLLPDNGSSPATNPVRSGPSPGFPLPNPVPWVAVPQHTVPSQLIVVLAQDPISRVPPITINISNIGNSNETTTIE